MKRIGTLGLVLGLATAACSSDEPAAKKGTINVATAMAAVSQASGMRSAVESKMGPMVAASAFQLNATSQGLVSPAVPGQGVMAASAGAETGMQSCTETGCTFTGWSADGMTQFDGTVMFSDAGMDAKKIVWDLTMKSAALGGDAGVPSLQNFNYQGKGDITVSATSLDGQVTSKGSVDTTTPIKTSINWDTVVKYQAITLANGKPTGGSIYGKVTYGTSAGVGGYSSEATHTFTP